MPLGTAADYEYAIAAEWDDVELEHGPNRKHDYHAFLGDICRQAAELNEITDANPDLAGRLDKVERRTEWRQNIMDRLISLASQGGKAVLRGMAMMDGFYVIDQEINDRPDNGTAAG
jgi:hypothetical protein